MRSVRIAIRSLLATPVLSLVVVLSLGLGIGANTAIFSLFHQVLLRSLPVPNPSELVALRSPGDYKGGRNSTDGSGDMDSIFSYPVFRQLEQHPQGLTGLAGYRMTDANLAYAGATFGGSVLMTSGGYFPLLGVQPLLGRTLTWDDDRGAGQPVVVLSYGYWKDKLGARSGVLNQPLRVNGQVFTIVGVLPKGFTGVSFTQNPNVYVPLAFKPALTPGWDGRDRWDDYWLYVFGRLAPHTTPARAQAALNSVYAGIVQEQAKVQQNTRSADFLKRFVKTRLRLAPADSGQSDLPDDMRTPLIILLACTGLVLLIAAGNAANLLLARAVQRAKEMAVRSALGAGRRQLIGQLLTEAIVLSAAGCVVGLLLGAWTLSLLIAGMPADAGPGTAFLVPELERPVLLFSVALSLATGVLFGLYPAWMGSGVSVSAALKEESSRSSSTRGGVRVRKILVGAQVTLSLLLLIPMGLFLESLVNLMHSDLGLSAERVITFGVAPALNGYKPDRSRAFFERAEQELAAIAGVRNVTAATVPLLGGSNWGSDVNIDGKATPQNFDSNSRFNEVGPRFFSTMGIPLINGREFTAADTAAAPSVAVVNETFVRHFLNAGNPIGHSISSGPKGTPIQIVGLVRNAKYAAVRQEVPPLYFTPYRQDKEINAIYFYVRTALTTDQIAPQVRRVMRGLDANLPLVDLRTLEEQVSLNIGKDRFVMQLACAFAILAALLAMLGLYGVMAYGVSRRRREIGIRLALGAGRRNIRAMVLREAALILAVGIALGAPAAVAVSKLIETQLYGVKSFDPVVIAAAVAALAAAGLSAAWLPAWAASRIDPQTALRYE